MLSSPVTDLTTFAENNFLDPKKVQQIPGSVDTAFAANIVGQLGLAVATGKWTPERRPGTMRGVDFYNGTDLILALVTAAHRYRHFHGFVPTLTEPSTYSGHLFARKFLASLPIPCPADKLGAREYVRARVGEEVLTDVVWVGDEASTLFTANLPTGRFVLKANHRSGANLFLDVPAELSIRREEIEKTTAEWLKSRYGYLWGEWHYSTFQPKLFLESFVGFNSDGKQPLEYKAYCFCGKIRWFVIQRRNGNDSDYGAYDREWKRFPYTLEKVNLVEFTRPANLNDLICVAEKIAAELDFARIDLYSNGKDSIKFSEVTFVPGNGENQFTDFRIDRWLGQFFTNDGAASRS